MEKGKKSLFAHKKPKEQSNQMEKVGRSSKNVVDLRVHLDQLCLFLFPERVSCQGRKEGDDSSFSS